MLLFAREEGLRGKVGSWTVVVAYLPFSLIEKVLGSPSAPVEEYRLSHSLAILGLSRSLLDESSKGRDSRTGSNHDDRSGWVGG